MSNALAIAGVTAVLQNLLGSLSGPLTTALGVGVTMPALAPEEVPQQTNSGPYLNLFLFQLTPNAAWRNVDLPSVNSAGERITRPPLAVDLHYLLTAYGSADLQAEVILGYAMQLLHENPILTRDTIRRVLNPAVPPATPVYQALQSTGLADQIEQIRIAPVTMNLEELSKLWTALQSNYRPSVAYQITVVLIETNRPRYSPLPVLSRGPVDPATNRERGVVAQPDLLPPFPRIESLVPTTKQIAAQLGDTLTVSGAHIDGTAGSFFLRLSNARLDIDGRIGPEIAGSASESSVRFLLPIDPVNIPAGTYVTALELQKPGETRARVTNVVPLTVAPEIQAGSLPAVVSLVGNPGLTLTPTVVPRVRPNQKVSLLLGGLEAVATPFSPATSTPSFVFDVVPPDTYWVRLRVDGVDSLLVDRSSVPPRFVGPQIQVTP